MLVIVLLVVAIGTIFLMCSLAQMVREVTHLFILSLACCLLRRLHLEKLYGR